MIMTTRKRSFINPVKIVGGGIYLLSLAGPWLADMIIPIAIN